MFHTNKNNKNFKKKHPIRNKQLKGNVFAAIEISFGHSIMAIA